MNTALYQANATSPSSAPISEREALNEEAEAGREAEKKKDMDF